MVKLNVNAWTHSLQSSINPHVRYSFAIVICFYS
jgi:hypothetical protein